MYNSKLFVVHMHNTNIEEEYTFVLHNFAPASMLLACDIAIVN